MANLTVTLHPPEGTGAWRLQLTNPPPNLPTDIRVMLDRRAYPFHAPPPTRPNHPINTLWRGEAGTSAVILGAVRAVAAGELAPAAAETSIAARLTLWSRQWARVSGRIADRRSLRIGAL